MTLKERLVGAWAAIKVQTAKAWDWATKKVQGAESMVSNLVSTEPGFEISKRVISSMPQAAITVIAIQMAMVGAGIGVVAGTVLVSAFLVTAVWATKARNEAIVAKD